MRSSLSSSLALVSVRVCGITGSTLGAVTAAGMEVCADAPLPSFTFVRSLCRELKKWVSEVSAVEEFFAATHEG